MRPPNALPGSIPRPRYARSERAVAPRMVSSRWSAFFVVRGAPPPRTRGGPPTRRPTSGRLLLTAATGVFVAPGSSGPGGCRFPDSAEADVGAAAVDRPFAPAADEVSGAVLVGTQKRSAALHALGHAGLGRVVTVRRALGIDRLLRQRGVVIRPVPVRTPLPDVASHVVEREAVRGKGVDGRRSAEPVGNGVRDREGALPDVRGGAAARPQLVAPGIAIAIEPAA